MLNSVDDHDGVSGAGIVMEVGQADVHPVQESDVREPEVIIYVHAAVPEDGHVDLLPLHGEGVVRCRDLADRGLMRCAQSAQCQ
jgi:hypothetical protein